MKKAVSRAVWHDLKVTFLCVKEICKAHEGYNFS